MIGEPIYLNDSWLKSLCTSLTCSLLSDGKRECLKRKQAVLGRLLRGCLRNTGVSSRLQDDPPETRAVILLFVYALVVATSCLRGRGQPLCMPGHT